MYSVKQRIDNEIVVRKSRFIGIILPITTEDDAKSFLSSIKKEYLNATHYTYAYKLGDQGIIQKASDDGEPTRTAGYPILEVLNKNELTDVILVVIRYFGGILLGAGGLIRAYSSAAADVVKLSTLTQKRTTYTCRLITDYDHLGNIDRAIRENTELLDVSYDQGISFQFKIFAEKYEEIKEQLFKKNNFEDRLEIIDEFTEYA